jgi:hypothetical protein
LDPSNRRISLIVQYLDKPNKDKEGEPAAAAGESKETGAGKVTEGEKPAAKEPPKAPAKGE